MLRLLYEVTLKLEDAAQTTSEIRSSPFVDNNRDWSFGRLLDFEDAESGNEEYELPVRTLLLLVVFSRALKDVESEDLVAVMVMKGQRKDLCGLSRVLERI
jgi:hypothetical protein